MRSAALNALHDGLMLADMSDDDASELHRLRIENEELRAKLIVAKGRASTAMDRQFRDRSPAEQAAIEAKSRAYLEGKIRQAGFDPSTEQGRNAYLAWAYARARGEPEPAATPATVTMDGNGVAGPAPPASDDPLAVYLPPPDVATPAGIARAAAIAEGRLVDLPKAVSRSFASRAGGRGSRVAGLSRRQDTAGGLRSLDRTRAQRLPRVGVCQGEGRA